MKATKILGAVLLQLLWGANTQAEEFKFSKPDIFVLGDSQLLFGSGPSFLNFFDNIDEHCAPYAHSQNDVKLLENHSVGVLGVRSTSLNSWVQKDDKSKTRICTIDPNWHINASTFGTIKTTEKRFLQIGQEEPFKFCQPGKSAFEVMFEDNYYNPKLFVMFFLGNSSKRWAESATDAQSDAAAMAQQIPAHVPCIFMTSAPTYRSGNIDRRMRAQENIETAFDNTGSGCTFVKGLTSKTIKANLGNKLHFKTNDDGKVKDPFHPNATATEAFFSIKKLEICRAILNQFTKP